MGCGTPARRIRSGSRCSPWECFETDRVPRLDASSEEARNAIGLVRDNATWHSRGSWHGTPVFAGEVEPCINGRVVAVGSYFGVDVTGIAQRLLGE